MVINTDINILGGLQDLSLITHFLIEKSTIGNSNDHTTNTALKTEKSYKRFERAINGSLLKFKSTEIKDLVEPILLVEAISQGSLLMLFWNASVNNDLLNYLNTNVFFPAFYSGRLIIKTDEVVACIKELRETEGVIKKWSAKTIHTVSYKFLALLKKFNLLTGETNKKILHPYLDDRMLILFIYWLRAVETTTNLMESDWLKYSFNERSFFIERIMQKKFSDYFQFSYTGDNLRIETLIPYKDIYHAVK